ncbi:dTMP kinase [Proteinivorax hydrogeniformans]|uniref:Thymidylate kinase n=1 Tax=Proteinivorax hydrogeniformans TaxID=1826727 RepID=A0AAU8HT88_9FIRM
METKGKFIVIEGPDGAGKTTQAQKLCELFEQKRINYLYTREPGGTDVGNEIRKILLDFKGDINPITETILYSAARAQLIQEVIKPKLNAGVNVIADRYVFSSIVYQGLGLGVEENIVAEINKIATENLLPDYTFYLDLDIESSLGRITGKKDRIEQRGLEYFKKVKEGYISLSKKYPIITIDGNRSKEDVFKDIAGHMGLL